MDSDMQGIEELGHEDLARLILDMLHRTVVHHTLWFREVEHQMGFEKALEIMKTAYRGSYDVQMKRLSRTLDFEMKEGIPAPLLDMPREKLVELVGSLGANWIAGDLT